MSRGFRGAITLFLLAVCVRCSTQSIDVHRRKLIAPADASTLDQASPFLKAHLRNGEVYVLSEWTYDRQQNAVVGTGVRRGINRDILENEQFTIPIGTVALFETNVVEQDVRIRSLAVMSGISAAVTTGCAISPKSCFGSCPTFYTLNSERPLAEGFSASIAPALEATDLDALPRLKPVGRELEFRVVNEALETQVIRYADVLAVRPPKGAQVFATPQRTFRAATEVIPPFACRAPEGDCVAGVRALDDVERFTPTDPHNLGRREHIDLEFETVPGKPVGLVLGARQTFLSTYLLYQTFAYLGRDAGATLAAIERQDPRLHRSLSNLGRLLDRIEVFVEGKPGRWISAGEFREQGPIATDTQLISLGVAPRQRVRVRLRAVRGMWRIDYAALAVIGEDLHPVRFRPKEVRSKSLSASDVLGALQDGSGVTTMPGEEYSLVYALPEDFKDNEFFLETRGYYLEWMRREWLAEQSRVRAALLLLWPRLALRMLAAEFKRHEPLMEARFWSSKYARD